MTRGDRKLMAVKLRRDLIRKVKLEAANTEKTIERVVEDILDQHFSRRSRAERPDQATAAV